MHFDPSLVISRRRSAGLTRAVVAQRVGVSASSYYKFEVGVITPSTATLGRLADALGCRLDELFAPDVITSAALEDIRAAVDALPPLGPDELDAIAAILARAPRRGSDDQSDSELADVS